MCLDMIIYVDCSKLFGYKHIYIGGEVTYQALSCKIHFWIVIPRKFYSLVDIRAHTCEVVLVFVTVSFYMLLIKGAEMTTLWYNLWDGYVAYFTYYGSP